MTTPTSWIIVGAGSAGSVLANRLSADPARQVTLIESGPDLTPGNVPAALSGPSFVEALAEPGRSYPELTARRTARGEPSVYQRGRGVGGSSAVNAMVALRGSADLYRSWGWHDADAAWGRVDIPTEIATDQEIGVINRALLASDDRTEPMMLTRRRGRRITSAEAYLWPVRKRPNLHVLCDAEVEAVVTANRVARGVRLTNGTTLKADRVILAAGAIHSPALLLRSGIDTAGIGHGLQDHPSAVLTLQLRTDVAQDTAGLPIATALHAQLRTHLVQLLPLDHLGPDAPGLAALMAALMNPTGRSGTVTIDGNGQPIVDFDLLADDRDLQGLTAATTLAVEISQRPAFTDVVEQTFIDDVGTTIDALGNDRAIGLWLRERCGDYVHASSTCAMGTVVGEDGAVKGYRGLNVCDASVFPTIPDANIHFPTTMLAELLSERMIE